MTLQHVSDEALREIRVGWSGARLLAVLQDNVIHHGKRRHQFSSGALGQQRLGGISDLDYQQLARLARLAEPLHMLGEQRIEVAGNPACVAILQPFLQLMERDDFRSGVQKQSLTVMYRVANRRCAAGW